MPNELKIKSNGLRNELKEIRKSIDKLTNAILIAQTNRHYEKLSKNCPDCISDECYCNDETGNSFGI